MKNSMSVIGNQWGLDGRTRLEIDRLVSEVVISVDSKVVICWYTAGKN